MTSRNCFLIWLFLLPCWLDARAMGHASMRDRQRWVRTLLPCPPRGIPQLASLDESAFSSIDSTNNIRPEWLKPPTNFFRLGPGDVIEVEMLGEATSRATVTIGPDGKIYYSLLPSVCLGINPIGSQGTDARRNWASTLRVKPETAVTLRTVGSNGSGFWQRGRLRAFTR